MQKMRDWILQLEFMLDDFRALSFDHKVVRLMLVLVAVSLVGAISFSLIELILLRQPGEMVEVVTVAKPKTKLLNVEHHPIQILPRIITNVETAVRQPIPGTSAYAAEAIYLPDNEDIRISNPFTVYASVTYYSSPRSARRAIQRQAEKMGGNIIFLEVGKSRAEAGLDPERTSYFIGWTRGNYGIEVDGAFKHQSKGKTEPMIKLAQIVAQQIDRSADLVLKGGVKPPDG